MKTFILIFFISIHTFSQGCQQLDILVLADMSGSVQGHEQFIGDAVSEFANQELGDLKIGVLTFSWDPDLVSSLTDNQEKLKEQVEEIKTTPAQGTTNLKATFYEAINEFTKNGRKNAKQIIILISDGAPDEKENTMIVAQNLKTIGIDIYCIMINATGGNKEYMQALGTEYFDTDYEGLKEKLKKINFCL